MGVGFEQILDLHALCADGVENSLRRMRRGAAGLLIEIKYAIDYGRRLRGGIPHQIAHRKRGFVKKGADLRANGHGRTPSVTSILLLY